MPNIFVWLVALGPYFLGALILGCVLILVAPWLAKNLDRWIFFVLIGLNLLPLAGVDGDGSMFRQVIWGSLFLYAGYHALRDDNGRLSFPTVFVPLSLFGMIFYASASSAWSPEVMVSLKRAIQLIGVLVVAVAVVRKTPKEIELLDQLFLPVVLFILLGLIFAVAVPSYAFDSEGALRAMTSNKNTWGQFSLLACIVFLSILLKWDRRFIICMVMFLLAIVSLLASHSTTSIFTFSIILALTGVWLLLVKCGFSGWAIMFGMASVCAINFLGYTILNGDLPFEALSDLFYEWTGKSTTLTGRTFMWELMFLEINRHLWFGIGYGGFWISDAAGASLEITRRLDWGPPTQAHNGYIDVVNELGLVGAALLLNIFRLHIIKIVRLFQRGMKSVAMFHSILFLSALILNYAESSFLRTTHFWWIILCVSIVTVHRHAFFAPVELPELLLNPGSKDNNQPVRRLKT